MPYHTRNDLSKLLNLDNSSWTPRPENSWIAVMFYNQLEKENITRATTFHNRNRTLARSKYRIANFLPVPTHQKEKGLQSGVISTAPLASQRSNSIRGSWSSFKSLVSTEVCELMPSMTGISLPCEARRHRSFVESLVAE